MTSINWTNITVKLGDLKAWERNPRQSTKRQAKKLLASWERFGQVHTIAVSPSLDVYDGHQRLSALLTLHGKGYEVDARQADRHLDEAERQALVLTLHAGAQGEWDWDKLIAFDAELLRDTFDAELLKTLNNDMINMSELLNAEKAEHSETTKAKCICANCGCECVA